MCDSEVAGRVCARVCGVCRPNCVSAHQSVSVSQSGRILYSSFVKHAVLSCFMSVIYVTVSLLLL